MNFGWAITQMQQGAKVCLDVWTNKYAHIILEDDRFLMSVRPGEYVLWAAPTRDMLSLGWREYQLFQRECHEQDRSTCA